MARIGPARPNSSLNDESIEVQPFHQRPRDDAEIRRAHGIGMSILRMHRAQDERRPLRARLCHEPERPAGRRDERGHDWIRGQFVDKVERDVLGPPHAILVVQWTSKVKRAVGNV